MQTTTDGQSSDTNSDPFRSSRSHTNQGDDTQREHSIGGATTSGRSNQQDQTKIKSMREDAVTASPALNTKPECRYGTKCRQQSDQTHCERFQHPAKTASPGATATADGKSSNIYSDTSCLSRSHTNYRNYIMGKAYSIEGAIALERD
ncbi:unnamed protein product [Rotaria sp. Silwood2]|nr:unnamed protein product [Rotaria sp. Silwood2]CAF2614723.1 unnamed protein product [Rotaria sp. Silwood2]CAF3007609.1 unnamed protein product [Rotaria sp. Silwood2]